MDINLLHHSSIVIELAQLTEVWFIYFTFSDCEYFTNLVLSFNFECLMILRKMYRGCRPHIVFLLEWIYFQKPAQSCFWMKFMASPSSFQIPCQIYPACSLWQVKLNFSPQWQKSVEKTNRVLGSSKQGEKIFPQFSAISSSTGPVRMGTIFTFLPRAFTMKGKCIQMLCSSSSSSTSSMWNPSLVFSSSTTQVSMSKGPRGVLYSSEQVRVQPGKYLW